MTDPNTPTQSSNNPQDLIDQALGSSSLTPTPAAETPKEEVVANSEQSLPTPEPLTQTSNQTVVEPSIAEASTPLSTATDTVPAELTNPQTEPTVLPDPPKETKPMGEDMPLAFMGSTDLNTQTTQQPVSNITVEPIAPASVPPILTGNTNTTSNNASKPRRNGLKVVGIVVAIFVSFGVIGSLAYQMLTGEPLVAILQPKGRVKDIDNKEDCDGESNGGWLVWRNGECKVTGSSGSEDKDGDGVGDKDTTNPNLANLETKGEIACKNTPGAQWCSNFGFCMKNDGSEGNCNNRAVQLGYTVQIGNVSCVKENGVWKPDGSYRQGENLNSDGTAINDSSIGAVPTTDAKDKEIYGDVMSVYDQVDKQCKAQSGVFTAAGKESYICREGVAGIGGVVYSGGACTELNGKKFTGTLGCFCGTVQVDTTNGHTSYSSTCGCDKDNPEPSTPTITTNPTLMCSSLTRTPTTTPAVGDKVAFTCVGASTPAGAVSLTYKFRYSLNSGAYVAMTNKTTTTSELTIASCGSYKVQCQTCGTINGVLTCDPNWTAATQ